MRATATTTAAAPLDYLLHLADNALILGQRNAEWCGHGPILEEDLALANNSLDLIGQARLLYQYAAQIRGDGATEDALAYFRDVPDFRNYTLLELPHNAPLAATAAGDRDYATTIVRNFLYSALMVLLWERLQGSPDAHLAAIAAKSLKEVRYHLRHSRDWNTLVDSALAEATLKRPSDQGYVTQGKHGEHSEHLGFVLAEMQSLARAHPQATW